jgi:hypothetical protein
MQYTQSNTVCVNAADRKGIEMNFHIGIHEQHITTTCLEAAPTEQELLSQWGFSAEEIASLPWLRQWYQTGGSDRAVVVRCLEFLRLLVRSGELEL